MRSLLLIAFCFLCLPIFGQTNNSGEFINVIGVAKGSFTPDMLTFNFSLNIIDKKQTIAAQKLNEQVTLLTKKIEGLELKKAELKLTNYNLGEAIDNSGDKPKNNGFEASESFELEVKFSEKAFNMVIDSISATKFTNLSFSYYMTFSDSLRNKIKYDLISRASDDAMQIATILAKSRNVSLGNINSIEYTGNNSSLYDNVPLPPPPPPRYYDYNIEPPKIRRHISMLGVQAEQEVKIVYKIIDSH
jgi:uncharacterized protein YggE